MKRAVFVVVAVAILLAGAAPAASAMNKTDLIDAVANDAEVTK